MNSPKSEEQNREEKTVKSTETCSSLWHARFFTVHPTGRRSQPQPSAGFRHDPCPIIQEVFSDRSFSGGTCGAGSAAIDGADAARAPTVMNAEGHSMIGRLQRGGGVARHSASSGTPSVHPDRPSHGRAHLATQVRWVHPDSPTQPLDIHRDRFPVEGKRATNGVGSGGGFHEKSRGNQTQMSSQSSRQEVMVTCF